MTKPNSHGALPKSPDTGKRFRVARPQHVWYRENECALTAIRANRSFLNQFSANFDGYDAYIRDDVEPWSSQFDKVHKLVDSALGINNHSEVSE